MEKIWIIGAGYFGRKAARHLSREQGKFQVVVVDTDESSLEEVKSQNCTVICEEGVDFLARHLAANPDVDWIIPGVPIHLAWEWLNVKTGQGMIKAFDLPDALVQAWPHPMRGEGRHIYVSHADFICPSNCSEPDQLCTKTGQPRKKDLFKILEEKKVKEITPFVIQSIQLGPGVGGYPGQTLVDLARKIAGFKGHFYLATACRCHGVVSGGQIL